MPQVQTQKIDGSEKDYYMNAVDGHRDHPAGGLFEGAGRERGRCWTRRWPPDGSYSEGEAWLSLGLRRGVRGRQNIRYGVNPMLVGGMFDLRAEGRTSLVANPRFLGAETEGYGGVMAFARSYDREEIVRAVVELPRPCGSR